MTTAPDYTRYSLEELHDALAHVDRHRYPDRAASIEREIAGRDPAKEKRRQALGVERPPLDLSKRGIAVYMLLAGAITLASGLDRRLPSHSVPQLLAHLALFLLYGGMVLSGVFILRRVRTGLWLAAVLLSLQLPVLQYGRLSYVIGARPSIEVLLWPRMGYYFTTGLRLTILWAAENQRFHLGVNLIPLVFLAAVVGLLWRRHRALVRLRARSGVPG